MPSSAHFKATSDRKCGACHADHTDKANYPGLYYTFVFMTTLLIRVFIVFGRSCC